jgi:hypothetical protein
VNNLPKKALSDFFVALFFVVLFSPGCTQERSNEQNSSSSQQPSSLSQQDTLTICEAVFEGRFTKSQIKELLDRALVLYDLPITEENYSRAASVLVTFRKEHGIREMDILDHMIRSHVPGIKLKFPEAAALSTVALKSVDK